MHFNRIGCRLHNLRPPSLTPRPESSAFLSLLERSVQPLASSPPFRFSAISPKLSPSARRRRHFPPSSFVRATDENVPRSRDLLFRLFTDQMHPDLFSVLAILLLRGHRFLGRGNESLFCTRFSSDAECTVLRP